MHSHEQLIGRGGHSNMHHT